MRLPRIRIWILMTVVALAALGLAGWVLAGRTREYSKLADFWARQEERDLRDASYSDNSVEHAKRMVQSEQAHLEWMEEFARSSVFASHPEELERRRRYCAEIQERLAFKVEDAASRRSGR
jgi:hypothetical protein